jgi:hypothetical protein
MVGNGNENFSSIPPINNPIFLIHSFSPTSKIAPQTTSTPCSPRPN